MHPRDRIVIAVPLSILWSGDCDLESRRIRWLNREALRDLLRGEPVQFVVANVGSPLRWTPIEDRFAFWTDDCLPHLADQQEFQLERFPNGMAYVASEWSVINGQHPIVLLEAHH